MNLSGFSIEESPRGNMGLGSPNSPIPKRKRILLPCGLRPGLVVVQGVRCLSTLYRRVCNLPTALAAMKLAPAS